MDRKHPLRSLPPPRDASLSESASFRLEEAYEAAKDARDIMRDKARREARQLRDYTADEEEITARHEVHNHTHVHMPSKPDSEKPPELELGPVKVRGVPRWLIIAIGAVVAAVTAISSRLLTK